MKKFKEYLAELNQLAADYPESLEYDIVTSKDDEGNGFNFVHYSPSIGMFDGDEFQSFDEEDDNRDEQNTICLN